MADQRKQPTDVGAGEVQKTVAEEESKGYVGTVPERPSNEEYSLQSGPESPGAFEARVHQLEGDLDAIKRDR